MRILTIGASGFIGSHVMAAGRSGGHDMIPLPSIRPAWPAAPGTGPGPVGAWRAANCERFARLCADLGGFDVVVNAAGLAQPAGSDRSGLLVANALQPAIVAAACSAAGVRRLVHVSTASVQGRMDPLDESSRYEAFSPYTASKAEGERLLLDEGSTVPPEVVLYRPASVHGAGRAVTTSLVRLSGAPAVPVSDGGAQPLPVALVANVAAGIVFAATTTGMAAPGGKAVVVHPSEGMTVRSLLEAFGARRLVSLPAPATRSVVAALGRGARRSALLSARLRWVELLWLGQSLRSRMPDAGFVAPVGPEGWVALGDEVRRARRRAGMRIDA